MKIHYRNITHDMLDAITAAKMRNRTIDHIELTPSEMNELVAELPTMYSYPARGERDRFDGVPIKVSK